MNISPEDKKKLLIALLLLFSVISISIFIFSGSTKDKDNFEDSEEERAVGDEITFPRNTKTAFWKSVGANTVSFENPPRAISFENFKLYSEDMQEIAINSSDTTVVMQPPSGKVYPVDAPENIFSLFITPVAEEGLYTFRIDKDGEVYRANIDWKHPVEIEAVYGGEIFDDEGVKHALFELSAVELSMLDTNILHVISNENSEELFAGDASYSGDLKVRLEDLEDGEDVVEGEHVYLFKKEDTWYKVVLNYPGDFSN